MCLVMVMQEAGRKVSTLLIVHQSWLKHLQSAFPRATSSPCFSATMAGTWDIFIRQQGDISNHLKWFVPLFPFLDYKYPGPQTPHWTPDPSTSLVSLWWAEASAPTCMSTVQYEYIQWLSNSLFNYHLWCQFMAWCMYCIPVKLGFVLQLVIAHRGSHSSA